MSSRQVFFQEQHQQPPTQEKISKDKTIKQNMKDLLDTKTGTIIASAIGMSIGIAFNDFIRSFVTNILQPLIIQLLYITSLNNYFDFASLISEKNNALSITTFISSIITFIFILFTVYYVNKYTATMA
jgi:large-conductance mechanosensitive channel